MNRQSRSTFTFTQRHMTPQRPLPYSVSTHSQADSKSMLCLSTHDPILKSRSLYQEPAVCAIQHSIDLEEAGLALFDLPVSNGAVIVRDPPRAQLLSSPRATSATPYLSDAFPPLTSLEIGHFTSDRVSRSTVHITPTIDLPQHSDPLPKMPRKRPSLQSIFAPSFVHSSPLISPISPSASTSRVRSSSESEFVFSGLHTRSTSATSVTSPRSSPPPDFLQDDDPFANLTSVATRSSYSEMPTFKQRSAYSVPATPRSPLSPSGADPAVRISPPSASKSTPPYTTSFPRPLNVRPAHKKPAFAPRPSLPSLHTLAQMNVVIPRRIRKGNVGARLPFEPWDLAGDSHPTQLPSEPNTLISGPQPSTSSTDFTTDLDMDFLDFSDDPDDDSELPNTSSSTPDYHHDMSTPIPPIDSASDIPDDYIPPSLTRLSSSEGLPQLTRSTSFASTSSSTSELSAIEETTITAYGHDRPRRSNDSQDSNASQCPSSIESDSDVPSSPLDDCIMFPRFRYLSTDISDVEHEEESSTCLSPVIGRTGYSTYYIDSSIDLNTMAASSVGTIRYSNSQPWARGIISQKQEDESKVVEGGDWQGDGANSSSNYYNYYYNDGSRRGLDRHAGNGHSSGSRRIGGSGGHGGDDGGDERRNRSWVPSGPSSDPSTEEESDSADECGVPIATRDPRSQHDTASDDDVPLAQRIPTALKAQKTIRKRFREEKDQRRRERASRGEDSTHPRERHTTLRPSDAADVNPHALLSSSQEAALHAVRPVKRERAQTLSGNAPKPFAAEDLTRKLMNIQTNEMPVPPLPTARRPSLSGGDRSSNGSRELGESSLHQAHDSTRVLRPMRSFHRSNTKNVSDHHAVPLPIPVHKLGRSITDATPRHRNESHETHAGKSKSLNMQTETVIELDRLVKSRRGGGERSTRTSAEHDGLSPPRSGIQRHSPVPVPPVPTVDAKYQLSQQRFFIGDLQRFNMVEIGPTTTAKDVLWMIDALGALKQFVGSGGWMIFEVAQDFGMERPIRSFEILADIQASWNKDKMVNMFVIKLTPLASLLSRSAIPSSSPMRSGYVEWEQKRGKWTKRWLTLREHSLWLSKRDSGKDETSLCSLSNFDGYFVTRIQKAPKPFVFAIKSTDNLSFFENTADYLHVFSCSQKDGEKWMESILLARSYVLHQERNVLFNPKNNPSPVGRASLSGSGPRKSSSSNRPMQPLINVAPQDVFEPGSLLYNKRA